MVDPLNKPLMPLMEKYMAYLTGEEVALTDLANFLSRADDIRSTSPGGVLAMTVYEGPTSNMAGYYPRIFFQGTYDNNINSPASGSYIPKSPLTVVFTMLLIGRECHGVEACSH
jgi:hypothetical protein